jgi:hypothetical protein
LRTASTTNKIIYNTRQKKMGYGDNRMNPDWISNGVFEMLSKRKLVFG